MFPNFLPELHTFKYIKYNQFTGKASYKVQHIYAPTFEERQKRLLCKRCFSPSHIIMASSTQHILGLYFKISENFTSLVSSPRSEPAYDLVGSEGEASELIG